MIPRRKKVLAKFTWISGTFEATVRIWEFYMSLVDPWSDP